MRAGPNSIRLLSYKTRQMPCEARDTRKEGHVTTKAEIGVTCPQTQVTPRVASDHQKLDGTMKDPGVEPSETAWPANALLLDFSLQN